MWDWSIEATIKHIVRILTRASAGHPTLIEYGVYRLIQNLRGLKTSSSPSSSSLSLSLLWSCVRKNGRVSSSMVQAVLTLSTHTDYKLYHHLLATLGHFRVFPRTTMVKSVRKADWLVDTTWYQLTNQLCAVTSLWHSWDNKKVRRDIWFGSHAAAVPLFAEWVTFPGLHHTAQPHERQCI